MEEPDGGGMVDDLGRQFGANLCLSEKERAGVVIGREHVEEALVGFHFTIITEVLTEKEVRGEVFVDRFTSLWRGKDGVSIRDIGDKRFFVRFVKGFGVGLSLDFPG
ncbi:hypothetical protein ACFX13_028700 [Malus domestica]